MDSIDISKRKGYFIATNNFIEDFCLNYNQDLNPFNNMIIFHIEPNFMNNTIKYFCKSPLFEEIESNEEIPEYKISFTFPKVLVEKVVKV